MTEETKKTPELEPYEKPVLELIPLDGKDIITTSGGRGYRPYEADERELF
ncbi:MAG: hypothetical protein ILO68_01755 [Clostridia bacterium]|nr:hypothetical protein [Clostridia bacterium]